MEGEKKIKKVVFLENGWTDFNEKNICCKHRLGKFKKILSNFCDEKKPDKKIFEFFMNFLGGDISEIPLLYFHENISRFFTLTRIFFKLIGVVEHG